jgi:raffinose/stachyose/melibiose transport system permease protein
MKNTISKKAVFHVIDIVAIAFFFYPILIALNTAFKSPLETAESVLSLPSGLYLKNFYEGMVKSDFIHSLLNSAIVTFPSVVLIVLFSAMGGYSIARHGAKTFFIHNLDRLYLASLMIPFQIIMIPIYRIFRTLGLQNSLFGMIVIFTGNSIAYATFLYTGFVKSVPKELEEAALIDGCGPYRIFFNVVFPLLTPVSATVAALHIMWLWNDFNISIILLQKDAVRTLTVKQYYFFGQYSSAYGMAFAAAILSMIPVIVCFLLLQKYIISGISAGAVKS